jgi:hypothetical protein
VKKVQQPDVKKVLIAPAPPPPIKVKKQQIIEVPVPVVERVPVPVRGCNFAAVYSGSCVQAPVCKLLCASSCAQAPVCKLIARVLLQTQIHVVYSALLMYVSCAHDASWGQCDLDPIKPPAHSHT